MTRQILEENNAFRTPDLILHRKSLIHGIDRIVASQSKLIEYDTIDFPNNISDKSVDTALIRIQNYSLYLSLSFSNFRLDYLEKSPIIIDGVEYPHLHIDLGYLKSRLIKSNCNFKEVLSSYLIEETQRKYWLYHPKMEMVFKYFRQKDEQEKYLYLLNKQHHYKENIKNSSEYKYDAMPDKNINIRKQVEFSKTTIYQHKEKLVASALNYHSQGISKIKRCNHCFFAMRPTVITCGSCGAKDFQLISLTHEFVKRINEEYERENLAEKSLTRIYGGNNVS